jgi:hypothetical protein
MAPDQYKFQMAIHDFQSARQKAGVPEILARIAGKSTHLLSYEEVAEKLRLHARTEGGVQHIPIDAIVGSVGRYSNFTRTFLPRRAGSALHSLHNGQRDALALLDAELRNDASTYPSN